MKIDIHDDLYPEHAKLRAGHDTHFAISEFCEFLQSTGRDIVQLGEDFNVSRRPDELIAEFLGVDPLVLEREKRRMLDSIREPESKR